MSVSYSSLLIIPVSNNSDIISFFLEFNSFLFFIGAFCSNQAAIAIDLSLAVSYSGLFLISFFALLYAFKNDTGNEDIRL